MPVSGNTVLTVFRRLRDLTTTELARQAGEIDSVTKHLDVLPPAPVPLTTDLVGQRTKPIQIWEGVVLSVDRKKSEMSAKLNAKIGNFPEHTATFKFEWIPEQDMDLLIAGAVFYVTLFRRLTGGTVQNTQEVRFRRLPSWSNPQIRRVREAAETLAKGMRVAKVLNGD